MKLKMFHRFRPQLPEQLKLLRNWIRWRNCIRLRNWIRLRNSNWLRNKLSVRASIIDISRWKSSKIVWRNAKIHALSLRNSDEIHTVWVIKSYDSNFKILPESADRDHQQNINIWTLLGYSGDFMKSTGGEPKILVSHLNCIPWSNLMSNIAPVSLSKTFSSFWSSVSLHFVNFPFLSLKKS